MKQTKGINARAWFYSQSFHNHAGRPDIAAAPGQPPIAAAADVERSSRLDAERVTLEMQHKSSRRLDTGREPITDSPLFGGPAQGGLF